MARDISKTWTATTSGSGTAVFDSALKATCTDPDGSSVAYIRRDIIMPPATEIEVTVLCRTISGNPRIVINYPSFGDHVANVQMDQVSTDLIRYTARFFTPEWGADAEDGVVTIGLVTSDIGECELYDPRIKVGGLDIDVFGSSIVVDAGGDPYTGSGDYIQYYDGRMVCRRVVQVVGCAVAWGSIFSSGLFSAPAMAKSFVGTVTRSYECLGGALGESAWTYTNGSQYGVARGTTSAGTFNVLVVAEGYWRTV